MSQNPLDVEGSIFSLSMMNPNLSFKSLKSGDRFILSVEILQEDWDAFQRCQSRSGMVLEAEVTVAALNQPTTKKPEATPRKPISPANQLHTTFFPDVNFQRFMESLTGEEIYDRDECKAALKRYLDVGSLSEVGVGRMATLMNTYRGYCEVNNITIGEDTESSQ